MLFANWKGNMSKSFDATLKELVGKYPADWLACLGIKTAGHIDVIESDLSTVSMQADKVLLIHDPMPWILHIELQASRDAGLSRRIFKYNAFLHAHHGIPVQSTVFLLRPEAHEPGLTGQLAYVLSADGSLDFRFKLVKVWQHPPEEYLSGGIGTLPLAPLCNAPKETLPKVIQIMDERLSSGTLPGEKASLMTAAYVLLGLRYKPEIVEQLFKGVRSMEESSTYQLIIAKGEARGKAEGVAIGEARGKAEGVAIGEAKLLLHLGIHRWGPPPDSIRTKIESSSVEKIERLGELILDASSWEDLTKESD